VFPGYLYANRDLQSVPGTHATPKAVVVIVSRLDVHISTLLLEREVVPIEDVLGRTAVVRPGNALDLDEYLVPPMRGHIDVAMIDIDVECPAGDDLEGSFDRILDVHRSEEHTSELQSRENLV